MKTLRLLRNIAVLFLLVMGLLAVRPQLGHAGNKYCFLKFGYNCSVDSKGNCQESKCTGGYCNDSGCVLKKCGGCV